MTISVPKKKKCPREFAQNASSGYLWVMGWGIIFIFFAYLDVRIFVQETYIIHASVPFLPLRPDETDQKLVNIQSCRHVL